MVTATGGLQSLGSQMVSGNAAAAAPTTGVLGPATDETSQLMAACFATHGGVYQAVGGVAAAMHELLVGMLGSNAATYEATEAINAAASL
jgi:hypothetical protein